MNKPDNYFDRNLVHLQIRQINRLSKIYLQGHAFPVELQK